MNYKQLLRSRHARARAVAVAFIYNLFCLTLSSFATDSLDRYLPSEGNASKPHIVATIPTGMGPEGIVVSPDSSSLYVANRGSQTVSIINASTRTVTSIVPVTNFPVYPAISPDGTTLYVACEGIRQDPGTVSVISVANKSVVAITTVGYGPLGIRVNPNGTEIYVPSVLESISVINASTYQVEGTIALNVGDSTEPGPVAFSNDGKRAYIVSLALVGKHLTAKNFLSVINTSSRKITHNLDLGGGKIGNVAQSVSLFGPTAYIPLFGRVDYIDTSEVAVVSHSSLQHFLDSGLLAGAALTPDGKYLYVLISRSADNNGTVLKMQTATGEVLGEPIPVGHYPFAIAISPDNHYAYVSNAADNTVSVIDIRG